MIPRVPRGKAFNLGRPAGNYLMFAHQRRYCRTMPIGYGSIWRGLGCTTVVLSTMWPPLPSLLVLQVQTTRRSVRFLTRAERPNVSSRFPSRVKNTPSTSYLRQRNRDQLAASRHQVPQFDVARARRWRPPRFDCPGRWKSHGPHPRQPDARGVVLSRHRSRQTAFLIANDAQRPSAESQ